MVHKRAEMRRRHRMVRNGRSQQKICPHLLVQFAVNSVPTGVSIDTVRKPAVSTYCQRHSLYLSLLYLRFCLVKMPIDGYKPCPLIRLPDLLIRQQTKSRTRERNHPAHSVLRHGLHQPVPASCAPAFPAQFPPVCLLCPPPSPGNTEASYSPLPPTTMRLVEWRSRRSC